MRLSSGLRVSRAADDAAGLAIRELMRANIAALNQGVRNVNDAISLIQTADGALAVIDEKLIRMKELAEQAATGTYTSTQRLMIDSEFQAMSSEITRIATATAFNGVHMLVRDLSDGGDPGGGDPVDPGGGDPVPVSGEGARVHEQLQVQASFLGVNMSTSSLPPDVFTDAAGNVGEIGIMYYKPTSTFSLDYAHDRILQGTNLTVSKSGEESWTLTIEFTDGAGKTQSLVLNINGTFMAKEESHFTIPVVGDTRVYADADGTLEGDIAPKAIKIHFDADPGDVGGGGGGGAKNPPNWDKNNSARATNKLV
jgi:flagellin-like hook-associated protein FlgL